MSGNPKVKPPAGSVEPVIIKKIVKGHGHHGGAWKVAYADFVTAMMALFMVLWLLAQTDESTKAQVSSYFRTGVFSGSAGIMTGDITGLDGTRERRANDEATEVEELLFQRAAKETRGMLEELAQEDSELAAVLENVRISITSEGLLIEILDGGDGMAFDLSSSALKPALVRTLQELAPMLSRLSNPIQVHGHTDARPFPEGSGKTNWSLSFERADAARAELQRAGIPATQFSGVFAHGASKLALPNEPFAAANRRLTLLAVRTAGRSDSADGEPLAAPGTTVDVVVIPEGNLPPISSD
jgi:chemotaxis protein MotB